MSQSKEAKQGKLVLWLRVPMVLALMVNLVLVARVPLAAVQEQRSLGIFAGTRPQARARNADSRPQDGVGGNASTTSDDREPTLVIDATVDVVESPQARSNGWSPGQLAQFNQTGRWLGTALSGLHSSSDRSIGDSQVVPLDVQSGIPLIPGLPSPVPPASEPEVVLLNPKSNGGAVSFLMNEEVVTLKSDQEYRVESGEPIRVQFHRGQGLGSADVSLNSGRFQFEVTENGWALVSQDQ